MITIPTSILTQLCTIQSDIAVSFCFSERTQTLPAFQYVRNRWRNNNDSNFYTRYYEYRGKFSCLCCHNKTSRYEVPIRDGPLFFLKGYGHEKLSSANIFFEHICLCKHFFPSSSFCKQFFFHIFSVLFICAKYYHCLILKLFFEEPNQ